MTLDSSKANPALLPASKHQRRGKIPDHVSDAHVGEESSQEARLVKATQPELWNLEVSGVLVLGHGAVGNQAGADLAHDKHASPMLHAG